MTEEKTMMSPGWMQSMIQDPTAKKKMMTGARVAGRRGAAV
jgi:hypothetical protein